MVIRLFHSSQWAKFQLSRNIQPLNKSFWTSATVQHKDIQHAKSFNENKNGQKFEKLFPSCIKRINVQVCGTLYQKFKNRGYKRYKNCPDNGINTDITYFDNIPMVNEYESTLVILPGTPGYIHHFESLIGYLTHHNVRIIAINFPSYELTRKSKYYRHSPEERSELLRNVLRDARVDNIDSICSHSSGIFVSLQIWDESFNCDYKIPKIGSLCIFNPIGLDIPIPLQPHWLTSRMIKCFQNDKMDEVLKFSFKPMLKILKNPYAKNSLDDTFWGGCAIHYNNREKV